MSEDDRDDEQQAPIVQTVVNIYPPMADSYRDPQFHAWVAKVNRSYLQRQYAARHISRA